MQRILRLSLLLAVVLATTGLIACGGEDATSADPNTLLKDTFSGKKDVKSGKLALDLQIDVKGGGNQQLQGPISIKLGGPFQSQGDKKMPKLDMEAAVEGAGTSFKAGLALTGDAAFVNFQGTDYKADQQVFDQLRRLYEQSAAQAEKEQKKGTSLQTLGLDPQKWLRNPKNEGEAKVGDAETVKITGEVDVARLIEDLNKALQKAGRLGLQGQAQIPTTLTEEQKRQVQEAVKDVKVQIFTGKDDKILRRMVVALNLVVPKDSGGGSAGVNFDMQLLDLNEDQEITAPKDAKPLNDLVGQLGGLGGLLGGAGAGGGGSGSGSGSGSGGSGSGSAAQPSQEQLQKFTECLEKAGSDQQKAAQCSELIQP